jgi:hypothetical protein
MEAVSSAETSVNFYQLTWRQIQENKIPQGGQTLRSKSFGIFSKFLKHDCFRIEQGYRRYFSKKF